MVERVTAGASESRIQPGIIVFPVLRQSLMLTEMPSFSEWCIELSVDDDVHPVERSYLPHDRWSTLFVPFDSASDPFNSFFHSRTLQCADG